MIDTNCTRCGAPIQFRPPPDNPGVRLLKRAKTPVGHCASCAMANWLQNAEPYAQDIARILREKGPEILLDRRVIDQMARILAAGCADAKPQEIDWVSVVIHWDLPFTQTQRPPGRHPHGPDPADEPPTLF
jgi:hypothetical protein